MPQNSSRIHLLRGAHLQRFVASNGPGIGRSLGRVRDVPNLDYFILKLRLDEEGVSFLQATNEHALLFSNLAFFPSNFRIFFSYFFQGMQALAGFSEL